jgi:hypothetical protein
MGEEYAVCRICGKGLDNYNSLIAHLYQHAEVKESFRELAKWLGETLMPVIQTLTEMSMILNEWLNRVKETNPELYGKIMREAGEGVDKNG